MNIKQLSEIHNFYTHFLAKITFIETSRRSQARTEAEKKAELTAWLHQHKNNKTFGENVRHEIFHMLDLVAAEPVHRLENKIAILERNCELIRIKMEEEDFIK